MKSNLKVLIVEDSLSYAIELERLIKSLDFNICQIVDNSAEAFDAIFFHEPDIIIMDIMIGGKMTGLEIGEKISHLDIPILYVTSLADHKTLESALKTHMAGFLQKPVSKITLINEIDRIVGTHFNITNDKDASLVQKTNKAKAFLFKKQGRLQKINLTDIQYIQSDDNYCIFNTQTEKFILRSKISQLEEDLSDYGFLRVHRKYIVNLKTIKNYKPSTSEIEMINGGKILLSRSKKSEFIKTYSL